jgi:Tol biopolymer transport system component
VAELQAGGTRLTTATRLTMEQSWNEPFGWTADSKAVLFDSNRRMDAMVLFKQPLDHDTAEPIMPISKNEDLGGECVSPEGSWILYGVASHDKSTGKLMRIPVAGGSPQLVLTADMDGAPRCAKSPATLCAIAERSADRKQLVFSSFDPVKGRGRELARWNTDAAADYYWDLSPDGTRIAILKYHEGRIRILWLNGRAPQETTVKGWNTLSSAAWAADGKGLFVSSYSERGAVLLSVDLQGNARLLWEHKGGIDTYGVPSPDGRHLAMRGWNVESNVWLMENF